MRILQTENGMIIDQDNDVLEKIEGSLEGIDVSDLRVNAEELGQLYTTAQFSPTNKVYGEVNGEWVHVETVENAKRYAVLKEKLLEKFNGAQ